MRAARDGKATVALVDSTRRELLLQHNDPDIRRLAAELFGESASIGRAEIIAAYRSALERTTASGQTDRARGEAVFRRDCMACHKIGPDLASSPSRDAEALLMHVLDPNRYVLPNYESYVVVDTDGRVFTGLIAAQTATSITLRREENKTVTILRTNIDELSSTGKSLMPDGFEKKITPPEMAALLAFLQASRTPADPTALPIGTLPGLIEPAGE